MSLNSDLLKHFIDSAMALTPAQWDQVIANDPQDRYYSKGAVALAQAKASESCQEYDRDGIWDLASTTLFKLLKSAFEGRDLCNWSIASYSADDAVHAITVWDLIDAETKHQMTFPFHGIISFSEKSAV